MSRQHKEIGMSISTDIKKSLGGDEYYSPQNVVDMITPYILRGGV